MSSVHPFACFGVDSSPEPDLPSALVIVQQFPEELMILESKKI
jgi:hypothetical protein